MASLTRWTWIWASSGSWWWPGKAGVLQCMGLQRVRHNWVTELNWVLKQQTYFSQFWRLRESEIMVRFLVKTLFLIYRWPFFPGGTVVKNPPPKAGDSGSVPGLGRSPGEGNGNPLQYFCLENPVDWGAWQIAVHEVAKSWTQLSTCVHTCTHTHTHIFSCILTWQKGEGREEVTCSLVSFLTVSFMRIPSLWLNHSPTSQPPDTIALDILISNCESRGDVIFSPWQISIQILCPFKKRFHLYKRSFGTCLSLVYFISLLPSRSTHIVTDGKISSFFMAK